MDRINGAGHVDHMFVAEDPATLRPPTEITPEWMNTVQEELVAIATMNGAALNPAVNTQSRDAITAYFQSRIDALVNASPAALDTLKELADALGDDPNFAATITNALALKAPLNSPELTGAPTAQTPAQFDNSIKLATTEFATKIGLSAAELMTITATTVLTAAAHAGRSILTGGAAANITLSVPLANTVRAGSRIEFMHTGNAAYSVTLQRQGADTINNPAGKTSVAMGFGDTIVIESDGVSQWFAVGGSLAMASGTTTGIFGASLAASSGYQKLPSGLIIQWGDITSASTTGASFTFPIAFTTQVYVQGGFVSSASAPTQYISASSTLTAITIYASSGTVGGRWIAIGK